MFLYDIDKYIEDPKHAIQPLAKCLQDGSLVLSIGAGASKDLGLPEWRELVERCIRRTNKLKGTSYPEVLPESASNREICEAIDNVEKTMSGKLDMGRSKEYRELVSKCLYEDVGAGDSRDKEYPKDILKKELLIAIGSLLMGSKRGSVREVFNFNFDDVLDWYLHLHGFDTQIVTNLPTLRRNTDVTIYHPHGYLPLEADSSNASDFLVFSKHSYEEWLAGFNKPWEDLWNATLKSRVVIFLGMSGDDETLGKELVDAKRALERIRPTGFWMFGSDVTTKRINYMKERNVVPLCFKGWEWYPDYLLQICRAAL